MPATRFFVVESKFGFAKYSFWMCGRMVNPADCKSAALRGIGGSSPSASTQTLGNGPVTPFHLLLSSNWFRTPELHSGDQGSSPCSSSKVSIREVEKRKARIVHDNGDSTVSISVCSAVGSVVGLEPSGRRFESFHTDQIFAGLAQLV